MNEGLQLSLSRTVLGGIALILLTIIVVGLFWLAAGSTGTVSLLLSYAAGLSIIFLPCTLPLVFTIVPLTMGQAPKKGLIMALPMEADDTHEYGVDDDHSL